MSGVDIAGLVEELVRAVSLRCHSHPGEERRSATERAAAAKQALLDALLAQAAELAVKDSWVMHWQTKCQATRALEIEATRQRDEALAALKASEERGERLSQELASARCPQETWQDMTTAPKDGRELIGFRPDQGVFVFRWAWMEEFVERNSDGDPVEDYDDSFAWWWHDRWGWMEREETPTLWQPLPRPIQGSLPEHADATNNPPSDPGTEQREAGV